MINTTILARYLPYGLKFKKKGDPKEYTLYSLSIEGDILLKDEDGQNVVVSNVNIGKRYKPILKSCTCADQILHNNDEGYQKHLDFFYLIEKDLAWKK